VREVYLDYNGSSPLDPRVAEVMEETAANSVGNASAAHRFGRRQAAAVDEARAQVADLVGASAGGVVFTSGATEANNLALTGAVEGSAEGRSRVLVSAVEHASVARTAQWLHEQGRAKVEIVPVSATGVVDLEALEGLIDDDVLLVSVMAANSETGVLNPVGEAASIAQVAGAIVHCDATQMVGRLDFDLAELGADLVSLSGHKICGPTGVGAMVGSRPGLAAIRPVTHGGGHERGLRSGSLNVSGIVGLGIASQLATEERHEEAQRVAALRDLLVNELSSRLWGVHQNGDIDRRLPNTASLRFEEADAEAVVTNMDPVAVSTGSACSSGAIEPSSVLLAMGLDRDAAFETVRFSLGRFTTPDDIDLAIERAVTAVEYVRAMTGETN